MSNGYEITIPATSLPLDLLEVKEFLRITDSEEDFSLTKIFIPAISDIVEDLLGRALINKTIQFYSNGFDSKSRIKMPIAQVNAIEVYSLIDGEWVEWGSSNYAFDADSIPGYIYLKDGGVLPSLIDDQPNNIKIIAEVGFGDSYLNIPNKYKLILLNLLSHAWQNRGTMTNLSLNEVKTTVQYFIEGYKKRVLA